MILDHLRQAFPFQQKQQAQPPTQQPPQQPPEDDNSFVSEDDALKDPEETTKDPQSLQTQEQTSYEVPLSQTLPGDTSILCIDQQDNGLWYYFKTEEGKETSKVGPFLLNFENEITRILKAVADNVKEFKADGMTLVAKGNFQGEDQEGQPLEMEEWEIGNYSSNGAKRLADLLNSWIELRKTMTADFGKEDASATTPTEGGNESWRSAMEQVDKELEGDLPTSIPPKGLSKEEPKKLFQKGTK